MALLVNGGGYLFKILEEHASIQRCQEAESNQTEYVQTLSTLIYTFIELNKTVWNDYDYSNTLARANWSNTTLDDAVRQRIEFYSDYDALIESKLIQFRDLVLTHKRNNWYIGLECATHSYWVYESAVLYSLTILTTIGSLLSDYYLLYLTSVVLFRLWPCYGNFGANFNIVFSLFVNL